MAENRHTWVRYMPAFIFFSGISQPIFSQYPAVGKNKKEQREESKLCLAIFRPLCRHYPAIRVLVSLYAADSQALFTLTLDPAQPVALACQKNSFYLSTWTRHARTGRHLPLSHFVSHFSFDFTKLPPADRRSNGYYPIIYMVL